jgi:hypothetical protein
MQIKSLDPSLDPIKITKKHYLSYGMHQNYHQTITHVIDDSPNESQVLLNGLLTIRKAQVLDQVWHGAVWPADPCHKHHSDRAPNSSNATGASLFRRCKHEKETNEKHVQKIICWKSMICVKQNCGPDPKTWASPIIVLKKFDQSKNWRG